MIQGLTAYQAPAGHVQKGHFPLPDEFDGARYVAKWVSRGPAVKAAQMPQPIPSEGVSADGWQVWKDSKNQPCVRTTGSGAFVLMFRPKALQEAVNKLHGNESRRRMLNEATGKTVAGDVSQDTGMLSKDVLDRIPGLRDDTSSLEGEVKFNNLTPNPVDAVVEAPIVEKQKSTPKFLRK